MTGYIRKGIAATAAVIMPVAALACADRGSNDGAAADSSESQGAQVFMTLPKLPRWALRTSNVRAGRGTGFDIVGSIRRGERVEVDGLQDGWFKVYRDDEFLGYAADANLISTPLPERQFTMHGVRFRVAEEGETTWRLAWTLDLENTGTEPYSGLTAILKFVDTGSHLLAADTAGGINLTPGERRTFSGTLNVAAGRAASIRNVGAEIN